MIDTHAARLAADLPGYPYTLAREDGTRPLLAVRFPTLEAAERAAVNYTVRTGDRWVPMLTEETVR